MTTSAVFAPTESVSTGAPGTRVVCAPEPVEQTSHGELSRSLVPGTESGAPVMPTGRPTGVPASDFEPTDVVFRSAPPISTAEA